MLKLPKLIACSQKFLQQSKKIYTQNMKMFVFKIFAYKHFVKTVIRISSSFEINHLISKELYQKQNGFKFM